jgi:type I restriction enzyme S subunit
MRKYPKYKESGVEWIGRIPTDWKILKVKHLVNPTKYYQIGDGDHGSIKPEMYQEEGIPYIRVQNLSWNGTIDKKGLVYISTEVHKRNLKSRIINGDILIAKTGATIGKIGFVDESIGESNTTSSVGKVTIDNVRFNTKFYVYNFQCEYFQKAIWVKGIQKSAQPGFNIEDLVDFQVIAPNLPEQQQIVTYLDQKTTLIDQIISSSEKKIELLKEQRTATINHAVTKGLNPKVKMKDSGVEWIGEIPEGWVVSKMKHIVNYFGGGTPSRENAKFWNGTIPWVTPKDMKVDLIYSSEEKITTDGLNASSTKLCPTNSLLIVIRSGILQRIIPIGIVMNEVTINQDIKCLTTKNTGALSEKYLFYFITGNEQNLLSEWVKDGTTVESIEMESFINQSTPLPNLKEQQQIVTYLDQKTKEIDDLIASEKKRIELLKEYRQSLISEVVTGKIKVTS